MTRRIAYYGIFAALAILFGYIERLIPLPIPLPGVKLGIANIVVVVVLYRTGVRDAYVIGIVRVVVVSLLFGSVMSMSFGLGGVLCAVTVMAALHRRVPVYIASAAGGMMHNAAQIAVACGYMGAAPLYYLPALALCGVATGAVVGVIATRCVIALRHIQLFS